MVGYEHDEKLCPKRGGKPMKRRMMVICLAMVLSIGLLFPDDGQPAPSPAKKLLIACGIEPINLDVSLTSDGGDWPVVENYGEYLISQQPNGDLVPGLASSWKVSPDGKVIDFTLRKDVKFHSGDPLTVKDVVFSTERGRGKNASVKTRLSTFERIEAIDDYHFRMYFKQPDVTFIPNRGAVMIVSKTYYDRVGEETFSRKPVATGPYKFVRYEGGEYLDLERFEDYWGTKPSVKEVRFLFVPEDTTRLAKLKAGEVHFINSVPYNSVKELENSPNLKTVRLALHSPTRGIIFQTLNPKTPWYDKRVRQAMAYAVDRKTIVNTLLNGIPNLGAWLAPEELGYDPSLRDYPYDPKKAKQLLAEAGYPNGFDLNFYWPVSGRVPMVREICEAIVSYFEAVGIRTKLIAEETTPFTARRRAAKKPDAEFVCYYGGGLAGVSDPTYNLSLYYTKDGALSVYYNPEVEKIVVEARSTVNDAKRGELIMKAVKMLNEELPSILMVNNVTVYGMQKNIDFTPTKKNSKDLMLVKDMVVN
jgi:peptide/nickel transport system substrate-binding protein